jgi:hypothetical protein
MPTFSDTNRDYGVQQNVKRGFAEQRARLEREEHALETGHKAVEGPRMSDEEARAQKAFAARSANHERSGAELAPYDPNDPLNPENRRPGVLSKGGQPDTEAEEQRQQDSIAEKPLDEVMEEQRIAAQRKAVEVNPKNLPRDAEGKDQFGDQGNIPGADPGDTLAQQRLATTHLRAMSRQREEAEARVAVEMNPDDKQAKAKLERLEKEKKEREKAEKEAAKLKEERAKEAEKSGGEVKRRADPEAVKKEQEARAKAQKEREAADKKAAERR